MNLYLTFVDARIVMVSLFDHQVPVVGFGRMKYFYSLVIGVNTVSIGKDMKVPSAYKGDLKFEKKKEIGI